MTVIMQIVRAVAARMAAIAVATAVLWIAARFGVEVTEDQQTRAVGVLTDALTGLGWVVAMVVYGIAHKAFNRKIDPADAAKVPTAGDLGWAAYPAAGVDPNSSAARRYGRDPYGTGRSESASEW